ncbi:kinesin-like protein KIF14 [Dinothrombium tinctorium]|uniref:Kinesin-like protein n=1 Tax=Dinothrombium tinctorium TaxID=1965070 RepID=A0A3S3SDG6_9ACAR|nr:kinesin-like protein KIF14 [Dinothrombium tinctorium]
MTDGLKRRASPFIASQSLAFPVTTVASAFWKPSPNTIGSTFNSLSSSEKSSPATPVSMSGSAHTDIEIQTPNGRERSASTTPLKSRRVYFETHKENNSFDQLTDKLKRSDGSNVNVNVKVNVGLTCDSKDLSKPEIMVEKDKENYYGTNFSSSEEDLKSETYAMTCEEGTTKCAVTVGVRLRPFNQRELEDPDIRSAVDMDLRTKTVRIINTNIDLYNKLEFQFDYCFNGMGISDQENVYNSMGRPLLDGALQGYNMCLFAYGQTGSGKSYSIMGTTDAVGILPRFGTDLFARLTADDIIDVEVSYFEVYNEKIYDLLSTSKEKKILRVREHPQSGPYVVNLSTIVVRCDEDFQTCISLGNQKRETAATSMNDRSSRSHAICTINITQQILARYSDDSLDEEDRVLTSKVNIVDLAGSERLHSSGDRFQEGVSINKSLLTLRKVITQLAEQSSKIGAKQIFIPYRESTLTWLLRESLGSNSRTFMLATISPNMCHVEETVSTLRYACQSRKIVNIVRVNEDPKAIKIRQLMAEIKRLKEQKNEVTNLEKEKSTFEKQDIEQELEIMQKMLDQAKTALKDKLMDAERKRTRQIQQIKERESKSLQLLEHLKSDQSSIEQPMKSDLSERIRKLFPDVFDVNNEIHSG